MGRPRRKCRCRRPGYRALVAALRTAGHEVSRSALRASFDAGDVTGEGRALKPSLEVQRPMVVAVTLHPPPPLSAAPEPVPLSIVHEDDDVLLCCTASYSLNARTNTRMRIEAKRSSSELPSFSKSMA